LIYEVLLKEVIGTFELFKTTDLFNKCSESFKNMSPLWRTSSKSVLKALKGLKNVK
jgi:hypothetical protein